MTLLKIEQLKDKIYKTGLSIAATERKAGLKRNYIQNLLYGKSKNATKEAISAISKALGCKPNEIIENYQMEWNTPESRTEWNELLTIDIIKKISIEINEKEISVTFEEILSILQDAYFYCINTKEQKIDENFITWAINKHYR